MRLSNKTEYAILALVYLARLKDGARVHAHEISEKQSIPLNFLQQILFTLKQAHVVSSIKGKAGGYCLEKPANKVSVAEIVRLFDGPLAPSRAVSQFFYQETPIASEKKVVKLLKGIRDEISKKLENTFLSDLV